MAEPEALLLADVILTCRGDVCATEVTQVLKIKKIAQLRPAAAEVLANPSARTSWPILGGEIRRGCSAW